MTDCPICGKTPCVCEPDLDFDFEGAMEDLISERVPILTPEPPEDEQA